MSVKVILISALCFLWASNAEAAHPTVTLTQGVASGSFKISGEGRRYEGFEGIPYARPPVGKYRFREPQATKPWRGIWQADKVGSSCLQYDQFTEQGSVVGDEDCLFVNVYRPEGVVPGRYLPVIVHIHGGAFMFGAGHQYGPKYIMDRDLIYVNFNYRVGPLGFLSTNDELVPGNNGLKDQSMALKWVKENIIQFGGDPNRITITGLSCGGASVHFHYLSQMSKGLFNRGISISGTALLPWTIAENVYEKTRELSASVGCPNLNNREMVECLKHRPARKIVANVKNFLVWMYNPFTPFGPVVERFGMQPFLTALPVQIIKSRMAQDLPWITSVASEEGLYPAADFIREPNSLTELDQNWDRLAPFILDYNFTLPLSEHANVALKVKQQYLHGQPLSATTFPSLVQMLGDRFFVAGGEKAARLQAAMSTSPVYFYRYAYRSKHSLSEFMTGRNDNYGVSHGDDAGLILDTMYSNPRETDSDRRMSKILLDMWEKFAIDGSVYANGVAWEPVKVKDAMLNYLEINDPDDISMKSASELGNRSFWESIPFHENFVAAGLRDEL